MHRSLAITTFHLNYSLSISQITFLPTTFSSNSNYGPFTYNNNRFLHCVSMKIHFIPILAVGLNSQNINRISLPVRSYDNYKNVTCSLSFLAKVPKKRRGEMMERRESGDTYRARLKPCWGSATMWKMETKEGPLASVPFSCERSIHFVRVADMCGVKKIDTTRC